MEVRYKTETYEVVNLCDQCHVGYMFPTGQMNLGKNNTFPHKCNNKECSIIKDFEIKYPFLEQVRVIEGMV